MSMSLCYWIVCLVWLVFGVWSNWPNVKAGGGSLVLFILLLLLGWKVFGPPLHG